MEYQWEWLVVVYLYLGGLGAGLFVFSAIFDFMNQKHFEPLARIAALLAPWPVALGAGLLIFDLGSPMRFWRLFSTVQWTSPMSVGSWLLVAFTMTSGAHMLLWARSNPEMPIGIGGLHLPLPSGVRRVELRRTFTALGAPMGLGVGIYTGVLLGAVPARPFWNTPMVAMLFLFSALSTAAAALLLVSTLRKTTVSSIPERRLLYTADIGIILIEIFLIVPYFLHNALSTASQARSLDLVLGGPFTLAFWIGFVALGLLLPLIVEVLDLVPLIAGRKKASHSPLWAYVSAIPVLAGGLVLRWVFVFAGQVSHFG